jgi:hypothetical protein
MSLHMPWYVEIIFVLLCHVIPVALAIVGLMSLDWSRPAKSKE